MAYYLEFDGNGQVNGIDFPREFIGDGTKWSVEFSAWNSGVDEFGVLGETDGSITDFILLRSDNTIDFREGGSTKTFTVTDVTDPDAVYLFQYEILSGNDRRLELFENGVSTGPSVSVGISEMPMNTIGQVAVTREGSLKYLSYVDSNNSANNRYYDPSASNGTGSILPETANNQDGTLVNFPTDDSQWVFYAAGGGDSATTIGLESSSEVGAPSVGQNHSLTTNGVESASEVGNPAVGQNHSLTTTGIQSASQVGTPTAGEVAGGDSAITVGLESASETGTPPVGQNHVLSTNGLDSASEVGQPSVGQVHILSSTGIESASTVGNPTALSVTGLLLGIKPSLSISVTEYSVTLAAPVYSFTVSQPKYTIQVTQPNYTVIQ